MAQERVQKILAQAGIASRRKAEEMIQLGEVTINGKLAKLGDKADLETDSIKVRGKLLHTKEAPVYIALYKPKGAISAMSDPEGRPSLTEVLQGKVKQRVYPIGRLDFSSEGLIIMTNDGAFAEKLQKMEGVPRVYHIKVRGRPDPSMIARLEKGARLGNRLVKPHSIRLAEELANKVRIEIVLTEAGAVDVKTLFEQKGFLVESIRRTAIGQITLRGLKPAEFRYLKPSQVEALLTHPELGLQNIPDDGQLQPEGQGFRYRRPQGDPTTTLAGKREAATAQREGGAKPTLPRLRGASTGASAGASKLPTPRASAGTGGPKPLAKPLAKPFGKPRAGGPKPRTSGPKPSFGGRTAPKSGIRVARKKSTRG